MVNAGHPAPLLLDAGGATYLASPSGCRSDELEPPVRGFDGPAPAGGNARAFTDGLIDRRDIAVEEGLERLLELATGRWDSTSTTSAGGCSRSWCRPTPPTTWRSSPPGSTRAGQLSLHIPADPAKLRSVRRNIARWLSGHEVSKEDADDIILASSEACANSIEHAYGPGEGSVDIEARSTRRRSDRRPGYGPMEDARNGDRGRGLPLIEVVHGLLRAHARRRRDRVRMFRRVPRSPSA